MSGENELIPTGWHLITAILSAVSTAFTAVVAFVGHRLLKDLDSKATNERVSSLEATLSAVRSDLQTIRTERQNDSNAIRAELSEARKEQLNMHGENRQLWQEILLRLSKL